MLLNCKVSIFLFSALLWGTCFSHHCYRNFPTHDLSKLDAKSIIEDINKFYNNFDARYKELEKFIHNDSFYTKGQDVQFYLYTQRNKHKPDLLDAQALHKSHFNPWFRTTVLVHGLQPLKEKDYGTDALRHALLARYEHNVIVMKYPTVAKQKYTDALKNSFTVTRYATEFLNHLLKTYGIKARSLHLVGFELGGHIVGNIGHVIHGVGRITGLDPAGALFDRFHHKYRLSPDDAHFVDVIHTSDKKFPKGLGLAMPMGHQDFYPNGGRRQPGCKHNITAKMAGGQDEADFKNAICDNERSLRLFIESVCDWFCTFRAQKCDSYQQYENYECLPFLTPTRTMGFHARKRRNEEARSKYYLDTNSKYPYCSFFPITR